MQECWPLRRPCFHPPVSCGARNDSLSSLATIFYSRRGGTSAGQRHVAARGPSRRMATFADRQFSIFSAAFGLVQLPGAAREKRAAVSSVVGHNNDHAAWIGRGGRHRRGSWFAYLRITAG